MPVKLTDIEPLSWYPLDECPAHIPGRNGKPISRAALTAWIRAGKVSPQGYRRIGQHLFIQGAELQRLRGDAVGAPEAVAAS